jgi:gliding motility-associated-like protein
MQKLFTSKKNGSFYRVFSLLFFYLILSQESNATTYFVINSNDAGVGSLRQAILDANGNPGQDNILFSGIPSASITLATILPDITDPVIINGFTATSYATGKPVIEINGVNLPVGKSILAIVTSGGGNAAGTGTTIKGLVINRSNGPGIYLFNSNYNVIAGCFIGTDITGLAASANAYGGIEGTNSSNNSIGGSSPADRNVISGNTKNGIDLANTSNSNTISGNYIGVGKDGITPIANSVNSKGISLGNSCTLNTIGGTTYSQRNIICNNGLMGIHLFTTCNNNTITGNFIGIDINNNLNGNKNNGIQLDNCSNNTIGGNTAILRNVISSNTNSGIYINAGSNGNLIQGNYIGVDTTGLVARANNYGIQIIGSSTNTISSCVISGQKTQGIMVQDLSNGQKIQGNKIGVGSDGVTKIGNLGVGVYFTNKCTGNSVGGKGFSLRNYICNSASEGVKIENSNGNTVLGNFIGVDTKNNAAGNGQNGVYLFNGSLNDTIGSLAFRNVIANNFGNGIKIENGCNGSFVQGNYIGIDSTGLKPMANINSNGVHIFASSKTTIDACVIGSNKGSGIRFESGSRGNILTGNYIGLGKDGTTPLNNLGPGMFFLTNCSNNTIGGATPALINVIGNNSEGIHIEATCDTNTIVGNSVGVNAIGNAAPNLTEGIYIIASSKNTIQGCIVANNGTVGIHFLNGCVRNTVGGSLLAQRNIISKNGVYGVFFDNKCDTNKVVGSYIGVDPTGMIRMGNANGGIIFGNSTNNTVKSCVISGNAGFGIDISALSANTYILGNIIGLNATKDAPISNSGNGIQNTSVKNSFIGGLNPGDGNFIAGNGYPAGAALTAGNRASGISLSVSDNIQIVNNIIGFTKDTITAAGNSDYGIWDNNSTNLVITKNYVGNNGQGTLSIGGEGSGINITGPVTKALIKGNVVGVDVKGNPKGNYVYGIYLNNSTSNVSIGGVNKGDGNIVAGNLKNGIHLNQSTNDTIYGNSIGVDMNGLNKGNKGNGIKLESASTGNIIGGVLPGQQNTIAANDSNGVFIADAASSMNSIHQNSFYCNTLRGIELKGKGNANYPAPKINFLASTVNKIVGKATPGSFVEVFSLGAAPCATCSAGFSNMVQGRIYKSTVQALGDSSWSYTPGVALTSTADVTATASSTVSGAGNTSEFSICPAACVKPVITQQPITSTVCAGSTAVFVVKASNTTSFQWQVANQTGAFANVVNDAIYTAKNDSLFIKSAFALNGYRVQVIATGSSPSCVTTSVTDTLKVDTLTITGSISCASPICKNQTSVLTLSAQAGTYQWMQSANMGSGYVNVSSGSLATSNVYTTAPLSDTTYFKVLVQKGKCTGFSPFFKVAVKPAPSIVSQPSNDTLCVGSNGSFTVSASGAINGYQWMLDKTNSGTFTNIPNGDPSFTGAQTPTLAIVSAASSMNGYKFQCVVNGPSVACSPVSNAAILIVNSMPLAGTASGNGSVCFNTSDTLVLKNSFGSIQWQSFDTLKTPTWRNIPSSTTMQYITPPLVLKSIYRAMVSTPACPVVKSNSVISDIKINPPFNASGHDTTLCEGSSVTLTAKTGFTKYLWMNDSPGQMLTVSKTGKYYVTAKSPSGCTVSDTVLVKPCEVSVVIPNVFTPGSDGLNDTFFIKGNPSNSNLEIFNRWGQSLFTFPNYQNNWDGIGASDGVYYYIYTPGNGKKTYNGWVTIFNQK